MSELINTKRQCMGTRVHLLTSASFAALMLIANAQSSVSADEEAKPGVWLELGGQLERMDGGEERFSPAFTSLIDTNKFTAPRVTERPPRFSVGGMGKVTIVPGDTNWIISASVRYGRSNRDKALHEESKPVSPVSITKIPAAGKYYRHVRLPVARQFSDVTHKSSATYAIADFTAGKDVGLGILGSSGTSTISGGVRFAQFTARSSSTLGADPNFSIEYLHQTFPSIGKYRRFPHETWDIYSANLNASRSFRGLGPMVSWDASAPLTGDPEAGQFTVDVGMNAAVLFGRQKAKLHHETKVSHQVYQHSYAYGGGEHPGTYINPGYSYSTDHTRNRAVTVPNVGGFAAFSLRFPSARVSLGYRADFFFGAIDDGIDVRKTYDRNFYGPFATISIGFP